MGEFLRIAEQFHVDIGSMTKEAEDVKIKVSLSVKFSTMIHLVGQNVVNQLTERSCFGYLQLISTSLLTAA